MTCATAHARTAGLAAVRAAGSASIDRSTNMREHRILKHFAVVIAVPCILASCQSATGGLSSGEQASTADPDTAIAGAMAGGHAATQRAESSVEPDPPARQRPSGSQVTLEEAVKSALRWHPSIDEAAGRISESEERIRAAEAGYHPRLNAGVSSTYRNAGRRGFSPRLELTGSQMLYDFGKVSSAVSAEGAGRNVSRARLLLATDDLARDTARSVVEVQRYRALSRLSQAHVAGVRAIASLVMERSDKGASTASDRVQADARVESALATQLQYESELNRWRVNLASLTGDAAEPSPAIPAWLEKACRTEPDWRQVPTLLEAEAKRAEAVARIDAARAEGLPTISLEAGASYDLGGAWEDGPRDDKALNYSVGVNVKSSLYNGGQSGARRRAASYAARAADAAIRTARLGVQTDLAGARSQIDALNRLIGSLRSRADLMVETRDLYRQQYIELGTRTLLDLLNAEQELHEAQFQIADSVHDLRNLNISCLYSSGLMRQSFGIEPFALRGKGKP